MFITFPALAVIIEFFSFVGCFSLALFIYTHRKALTDLRRAFRRRKDATNLSTAVSPNGQAAHHDLEKGIHVPPGRPTALEPNTDPHIRILTYLHELPQEASDYMTMREISIGPEGGQLGVNEIKYSEAPDDSSWIEIINNFPPPPDAALVRSLHENSTSANIGLGFIFDGFGAVFPARHEKPEPAGDPKTMVDSRSQEDQVVAPELREKDISGPEGTVKSKSCAESHDQRQKSEP